MRIEKKMFSVNFIYHQIPKKFYLVSAFFCVYVFELCCCVNNEIHNQWAEKEDLKKGKEEIFAWMVYFLVFTS